MSITYNRLDTKFYIKVLKYICTVVDDMEFEYYTGNVLMLSISSIDKFEEGMLELVKSNDFNNAHTQAIFLPMDIIFKLLKKLYYKQIPAPEITKFNKIQEIVDDNT